MNQQTTDSSDNTQSNHFALYGDLEPPIRAVLESRLSQYRLIPLSQWQQLQDDQEAVSHLKSSLMQQMVQDDEEKLALRAQVASLKEQIIEQTHRERSRQEDISESQDVLEKKREALKIKEDDLRQREIELTARLAELTSQQRSAESETIELLSSRIKELENQMAEDQILKTLAEREQRFEITQRILHERAERLKETLGEKEAIISDLKERLESTPRSQQSTSPASSPFEDTPAHTNVHAVEEFRRLVRAFIIAIRQNDNSTKQAILPALCALSNMSPEESCSVLRGLTPLPRL